MAISYNPRTVTDGLVLALDAGNPKSYDANENLITYSEQFDFVSTWTKIGATISANSTTSPTGQLTADTLVEDTSTGTHRVVISTTILNSNVYTVSAYAKQAGRTNFRLALGSGLTGEVIVNLSNGTVASSTGATNIVVENVGNGWYRISFTAAASTGTTGQVQLQLVQGTSTTSYTGDNTSGVFIWGAQLESGSSVGPYYGTTATTKTRGTIWTDLSGRGNNGTFGASTAAPTYNSANGGSIVFDGVDDFVNITSNTNVAGLTNYSVSIWVYFNLGSSGIDSRFFWRGNYGVLLAKDTGNQFFFYIRSSITTTGSIGGVGTSSSVLGNWNNIALTYDGSTMRVYLNGNLAGSTSTTGGIINDDPTIVRLGFYPVAGFPSSCRISGCLEYTRTLSAAEIRQNFNALRSRYGI